jgi:hypothetical protein
MKLNEEALELARHAYDKTDCGLTDGDDPLAAAITEYLSKQWRAIETAPRDGRPLLLWLKRAHLQDVAQGFRPMTHVVVGDLFGDGNILIGPLGTREEVTHWMPEPDPPE